MGSLKARVSTWEEEGEGDWWQHTQQVGLYLQQTTSFNFVEPGGTGCICEGGKVSSVEPMSNFMQLPHVATTAIMYASGELQDAYKVWSHQDPYVIAGGGGGGGGGGIFGGENLWSYVRMVSTSVF